ncbi:Long chain fatty acid CoA ligase [Spironucleus salmonicida]|uniref:Long chain fatty acid CoA ligase n=1 Tax=Spironucleus salmonicida TaxID=348837 RepID=S5U492_9EUKA|nr:long chain fatty acid CoA ligase [Spironucleus salmonicida]KAH0576998.1 Long chain fatty acid CoA ligase [Spironucleus salmonicida]|eukprot:EST43027.1 Long chain fatty acid CoA ligase [Spironucleus salmonicida]
MKVKNHDYKQTSHLQLNQIEEPPLDKTYPQNFINSLLRNGDKKFLSYRSGISTVATEINDVYKSITYNQSTYYIQQIVNQLKELYFTHGDRVGIYAKNSPLWLLCDIAIQFSNGISVPIYDTLGVDNIKYCLNLVGCKYIFVSSEYSSNIVGMLDILPNLEYVILLDPVSNLEVFCRNATKVALHFEEGYELIDDTKSLYTIHSKAGEANLEEDEEIEVKSQSAVYELMMVGNRLINDKQVFIRQISLPKEEDCVDKIVLELPKSQNYDQPSSVIFTSGTSGFPKATVLNHTNTFAGGATLGRQFIPYSISDANTQSSMLSYLPLAHVFERAMEHTIAYRGYNIYYSSGNIKNLTTDLKLAQPTVFIGVPRVYQKIYDAITLKIQKSSLPVKLVFNLAYKIKSLLLTSPAFHKTGKLSVVDKVAFKKIHEALGGKVEFIVCGSSSLRPEVEKFLQVCSCARLSNGYGMTEISSAGLYNYCGQFMNNPGQLGFAAYDVDAKITNCDQCEFSLEKDHIGELCIKGSCVAMGYVDEKWGNIVDFRDSDGYFHTGDLCKMNNDGSASFVRRVNLVVKLQHGEFVDLAALENILESAPFVVTAFVHASASRAAPVAILSVDSKVCFEKFGTDNIEKLEELIEIEGEKIIKASGMKGFNVPRAYKIYLDVDWTVDRDLFTPSQKKQHINFRKRFASELDGLLARCDKGSRHVENVKLGFNSTVFAVGLIFTLISAVLIMKK